MGEGKRLEGEPASRGFWTPGRASILLAVIAVAWLVLDRLTKLHFDRFGLGDDLGGPFFDLFQFTLVHNTGAAWGMFSGSTFPLAIFSVLLSVAVAIFVVENAKRSNWMLVVGGALVVAGGLGNAVDRFALGYVVDFIRLSFVDFPVFNIADIGVTCGFVLIIISIVFFWRDGAQDVSDPPRVDAEGSGEGADGR